MIVQIHPAVQRDLVAVVRDAAELEYRVLNLCGGDPLRYPELLAAAKAEGLGTTVTTGTSVLTPALIAGIGGLVDLVVVSLDSARYTVAGIRRLADAGIPVGVLTTLTAENTPEIGEIARVAASAGASQFRLRPGDTDDVELVYAAVETRLIAEEQGLTVQLDAVPRSLLASRPEAFLAVPLPAGVPLGRWLTPLVVEEDGTVVPLRHHFGRRYALGSLREWSLAALARDWNAGPLLALCRSTWQDLMSTGAGPLVPWYEHLLRASRVSCSSGGRG